MKNIFILTSFFFLIPSTNAEEKYKSFKETYSNKELNTSNHQKCLKASDYQGCMDYMKNNSRNSTKGREGSIDCADNICTPEKAKLYGTDNFGMKVIPGYYFSDNPAKRSANYFSSPFKLNVNGRFGRYVHIQRVVRYYSRGYSGSLTTIPGIYSGSYPTISYNPGKAPGVRQILVHNVFDCDDKTFARFNGNKSDRLMWVDTKSGKRKKKWISFDDAALGYTFNRGKEACSKSKEYIMSLKSSPFTKFENKTPKSSLKKTNSDINCNSPVWKNNPRCN